MIKLMSSRRYLPYNCNLVSTARELRKNLTPAEKYIWDNYLKTFPYKVLKQRLIDNFIVDFYCPQLKLVIEIDGDIHLTSERQDSDTERTIILEGYGLKVIRFTNEQVLSNLDFVGSKIASFIPQ